MATIAMTDQLGTLGCKIAWELAKALGLQCIDSLQIEELITKRLRLGHNELRCIVDGGLAPRERRTLNREQIGHLFAAQLIELADQGDVILRCAGSAAILRPLKHVLCVRLQASDAYRARAIADRLHYQDLQMGYWDIEHADTELDKWARVVSDADWRSPDDYDAVLDAGAMPVADCVEAIIGLIQSRNWPDRRSDTVENMWRRMSDDACKSRCH